MKTNESNPADWYQMAEDRLRAADAVFAQPGVSYAGVELLHEAVERYLKGYLVSQGWVLRRTHDLGELLAEATAYNSGFTDFTQMADNLTDQFWAQHYPGGDLTGVGSDSTQLREDVGKLVKLILSSA
jgi:HEPN domain-containing protein